MELVQSILRGKDALVAEEIWQISGMLQDQYRSAPNILELDTERVIFVGDLHGELQCARAIQKYIEKYQNYHFVFLGDYADRGPKQIDTFNLIVALTLAYSKRVIMLRGNHESDSIASKYGFYNEVTREYSFDIFKHYSRVFEVLPLAVYKEENFFACHGGIPEGVTNLSEIQARNRRHPDFPDDIVFQMVWNDPRERDYDFRPNIRSSRARYFGKKAFTAFMTNINAKFMFRAHEVFPEGYQTFFNEKLVSVFSCTYGPRVKPKIIRLGKNSTIEPIALF